MRNLELKARCADLTQAEQTARQLGATFGGELRQTDTYFHAPRGRLKLREIRQLGPGDGEDFARSELIFYQRPEADATRWSDYCTSNVGAPATMRELLTHAFGLRQVVQKTRRLYLHQGARIHLDDVAQLGTFIEFEVPTNDGDEARAHTLMRTLMHTFGLTATDALHSSYGDEPLVSSSSSSSSSSSEF